MFMQENNEKIQQKREIKQRMIYSYEISKGK